MSTITSSTGATTTPHLVLGYSPARRSGNKRHTVIGRADPDYTLRPAATRVGTMRLFYLTEADATASAEMHAAADTFTLAAPELPIAGMVYVVADGGQIQPELVEPEFGRWVVSIDYEEVIT